MEVKSYLLEVAMEGGDKPLESLFYYSLGQVFSPTYLKKINDKIKSTIKIREVVKNDKNIVAYQTGTTIFVNRPVFFSKIREHQMRYLLHEFVHILQSSRQLFFVQNFKELNVLSKELYTIVKKGLIKSMPVFLTGKEVSMPTSGPEEILAYLMNGKVDWSAITPEAKREFLNVMEGSGLFNLKSNFWVKRLY